MSLDAIRAGDDAEEVMLQEQNMIPRWTPAYGSPGEHSIGQHFGVFDALSEDGNRKEGLRLLQAREALRAKGLPRQAQDTMRGLRTDVELSIVRYMAFGTPAGIVLRCFFPNEASIGMYQ